MWNIDLGFFIINSYKNNFKYSNRMKKKIFKFKIY